MAPFHPSGLVGRTEEEIVATYEQVIRTQIQLTAYDVCPRCYGTGSFDLVTDESVVPADLRAELTAEALAASTRYDPENGVVDVVWTCSQCGVWMDTSLGALLCRRPTVAEFYRDHGVDPDAVFSWTLPRHLGELSVIVIETDPLSLQVTVTLDEETLTVSVEDGFSVVTAERTPAFDSSSPS